MSRAGLRELNRFSLFAFLLAFQMLEEKSDRLNLATVTDVPLLLAAFVLLVLPNSTWAFLAFAGLQAVNTAEELPTTVNHAIPLAAINVGFIITFWQRRHELTPSLGANAAVLRAVEPVARWIVIAVYLLAAFHKLNSGFFDAAGSCFADTYGRISDTLGLLPGIGEMGTRIGIIGTVGFELALPLLLVFRRTRLLGVALGCGFHLFLGLRHPSFSTLIFALYLLFIPPEALSALRARLPARPLELAWRWLPIVAGVAAVALWYAPRLFLAPDIEEDFHHLSWFWLFVLVLAGAVALASRIPRAALTAPLSTRVSLVGAVLLIGLVLNGLTPYLGLKTTTAFSMYSNLRTEGDSNHFLIPKGLIQVVDEQDDLVEIRASSYGPLRESASGGWRMPFLELREAVTRADVDEPIALMYRRAGRTVRVADARADPNLNDPAPLVVRRLVDFRDVPPPGVNRCQW